MRRLSFFVRRSLVRRPAHAATAALVAVLLMTGMAVAYFSGALSSGSNASAKAASLPQAGSPSVSVTGNSVHLSWTQSSVGGAALGSYTGGGYTVQRYSTSGGGPIAAGSSCAGTISGPAGTLNCTESGVSPGTWYYEITAVLNNWTGQSSAASANVITGVATNVLSTSANPANVGSPVTYTATVSGGGATPTGTVTFEDGGVAISACGVAGVVSLSGGVATCTVTYATVGSHSITAPFGGDSDYSPAAGNTIGESVTTGTATDTVTSSANPSFIGGAVTYTATVAGGGATPTGSVTFKDGGAAISGCGVSGVVSLAGGVATCSVSYGAAGSHSITAAYGGDVNYNAATSNTLTQSVILRTATDTVTSSQNPSLIGGLVTYTATVTGSGPAPTGSVTFKDGGVAISGCGVAGVVSLTAGVATCSVTYAAGGSHSITAAYSGDPNYSSAAGNTVTQVVSITSTTTLVASYNPIAVGASLVYTVTVTGSGGTPSGSVTFKDGGVAISSCGTSGMVTLSGGVATCTLSYGAAGSHSITAVYGGDSAFAPSTSSALALTVSSDSNTLTLSTPTETGGSGKMTFSGTATAIAPVTVYYCTGTLSSCTSAGALGSVTVALTKTGAWTSASVQLTKGTAYTAQAYQTDPLGLGLVSGVQHFTP